MRIARLAALGTLLALTACTDGSDDTGNNDDVPIPTGRTDCGDTPPEISNLVIQAGEPDEFETSDGIKCLATVEITASVTDVDGDLHYYVMDMWWDGVVDGRVLAEGPKSRIEGTLGDDCEVSDVPGITMRLGIAGGGTTSPAFETETEFGIIIEDDAGNATNDGVPQVVSIVTPPAAAPGDCE